MIQPMGARVLVKRLEAAKPTSSLIIIPDTVEDGKPSQFGLVIALGTKVREAITPGDVVILKDYTGAPVFVKLDGPEGDVTECTIVPEDDILMVIEGF
jgi:chaperonin GroES